MLQVLEEIAGESEFDFGKILVEVYPQRENLTGEKQARSIFLEVNKAEPVKLVDLPGVAKPKYRKVINEGAALLQERFPDMFKPSQRCRVSRAGWIRSIEDVRSLARSWLTNQAVVPFPFRILPQAPHVNIDNLRDALFASNALERHNLTSAKALETWVLGQNEMLSVKFQEEEEARALVTPNALKKAIKFDFYLGLDSSWYYK